MCHAVTPHNHITAIALFATWHAMAVVIIGTKYILTIKHQQVRFLSIHHTSLIHWPELLPLGIHRTRPLFPRLLRSRRSPNLHMPRIREQVQNIARLHIRTERHLWPSIEHGCAAPANT